MIIRTGLGFDAHRFAPDVSLHLAGLEWPEATAGLAGHSDGDVAAHAICDALFSAAGEGDLGSNFGVDDPAMRGASGAALITMAVARTQAANWSIANVSVQIIGNRPKLATRRAEAQARLSGLVGAPVSVSATTTDGMGFTGAGEGVAAIATVLLTRDEPAG
jgi:2-C-methyl-D-erythritol 2,4-cyclodiphosphate synthase